MDNRQAGYPAIAKAQRLSAERLRARADLAQEPPSEQRAIPFVEQVEFRERTEQQEKKSWQGGAHLHQGRLHHVQQQRKTTFFEKRHADNSSSGTTITGGVRLSPRRRVPPSSNQAVARDLSGRSRSISPLPPRHHRGDSGSSPAAEKRTFADVEQIFCGVRGEAVALDRFISLEVTPAAQQAFDAAISEHAKAYDLLEGLSAALPKGVDADQKQNVAPRPGFPQAVNSNSANDDSCSTSVPAVGATTAAAAAAAVAVADDVVSTTAATSTVVAEAAAVSSDATAGAITSVNKKLLAYRTTANSTEGWPRAEDAPVVTAIPPPAFCDRVNLPARGRRGTKTGRPPIVDFIGRGGGGGGGRASASTRASAWENPPARPHCTKDKTGMTARYHVEREGEGEKTAGSRGQGETAKDSSGQGRVGDGAVEAGGRVGEASRKSEFDEQEDDEEDDEEEDEDEEDEGWGEPLPGVVLATDISSKIVGLSSRIRRKAAEGLNDDALKR